MSHSNDQHDYESHYYDPHYHKSHFYESQYYKSQYYTILITKSYTKKLSRSYDNTILTS